MKKSLALFLACALVCMLTACGSAGTAQDNVSDTAETVSSSSEAAESAEGATSVTASEPAPVTNQQTEAHIYDNGEVRPVMNGYGTEQIGEYSVVYADSKDCTEEALADWYYNYICANDFNYSLIVYSDNEKKGCYGTSAFVEKDVAIEKEEGGALILGSEDGATSYGPSDDGKTLINLKESLNTSETSGDFVSDVEAAIDGAVGDGEKISGVSLDDKVLTVTVDFSNASFDPLTPEMLAESRVSSITEEILAMDEYDNLWDKIVIDFGEYGKVDYGKSDIVDGGFGRYFDTTDFSLQ